MNELLDMGWKRTTSGRYSHPNYNAGDGRRRLYTEAEALRIQKRMTAQAEMEMERELRRAMHDALTRPLTNADEVRARMNLWSALGNPWGALLVKNEYRHLPGVDEL